MSIRHLNLQQGATVTDPLIEATGTFCGWAPNGRALVHWHDEGFDGPDEENPDELDLVES